MEARVFLDCVGSAVLLEYDSPRGRENPIEANSSPCNAYSASRYLSIHAQANFALQAPAIPPWSARIIHCWHEAHRFVAKNFLTHGAEQTVPYARTRGGLACAHTGWQLLQASQIVISSIQRFSADSTLPASYSQNEKKRIYLQEGNRSLNFRRVSRKKCSPTPLTAGIEKQIVI